MITYKLVDGPKAGHAGEVPNAEPFLLMHEKMHTSTFSHDLLQNLFSGMNVFGTHLYVYKLKYVGDGIHEYAFQNEEELFWIEVGKGERARNG